MAKRVVQECDLTKQEYDPAETVTLVIKKSGKKTGRTYELSAAAAAKLEQQLVSGNKLPEEWDFVGGAVRQGGTSAPQPGKRTLADLDTDEPDDAAFVAEKKRSLAAEGVDAEPRETQEDDPSILGVDTSGCMHPNRGPVAITMSQGKRLIYRMCRDCRKRIPEKTKDEKAAFLSAKPPPDTREGQSAVARKKNES